MEPQPTRVYALFEVTGSAPTISSRAHRLWCCASRRHRWQCWNHGTESNDRNSSRSALSDSL